jgi:hypothetical protein
MPINWLIGRNSLRSIRDDSRDFARNAYDPSTLNPMRDYAQSVATQGVDTNRYRRSALESLSQDPNLEMAGGRAATAMGIASEMDSNRAGAISQFEANLMDADLSARQQGREQLANIQSQQRSIAGTREAALNQIDANYEAELSARRRTLGVAAVGFGISAAGGTPAIGRAIGGLFGGGDEALDQAGLQSPGVNPYMNEDGFDNIGLGAFTPQNNRFQDPIHDNTDELNSLLFSPKVNITPPNRLSATGVTARTRSEELNRPAPEVSGFVDGGVSRLTPVPIDPNRNAADLRGNPNDPSLRQFPQSPQFDFDMALQEDLDRLHNIIRPGGFRPIAPAASTRTPVYRNRYQP